ncbi:MAG: TetR/AcrR family transcriptional regulator [Microthrixaceae bacterium]
MSAAAHRPPLQRSAIVDAACELVATAGLEALTLRRLADVFSVSAPALYAHFVNKHELLRAVAEREFDGLIARYEQINAEVDRGDPLARVRAQCRNYVRHSLDNPELFKVMFLFPPDLGDITSVPEGSELPAAARAFSMAVDAIGDAINDGAVDSDDPLMVALTLWAGVHGVANLFSLGLGLPAELQDALTDEVIERMLSGYGASVS